MLALPSVKCMSLVRYAMSLVGFAQTTSGYTKAYVFSCCVIGVFSR